MIYFIWPHDGCIFLSYYLILPYFEKCWLFLHSHSLTDYKYHLINLKTLWKHSQCRVLVVKLLAHTSIPVINIKLTLKKYVSHTSMRTHTNIRHCQIDSNHAVLNKLQLVIFYNLHIISVLLKLTSLDVQRSPKFSISDFLLQVHKVIFICNSTLVDSAFTVNN